DTAASGTVATVAAPASTPSTEPNAANALSADPNQQAAQAANRATEAVQAPTGRTRSSAFSNAPASAGLPPNVSAPGNSQIQLQRRPQPVVIPDSSAVGPQGTAPAPSNTGASGQAVFTAPPPSSN
ncbi:MAG: outer membrane protein assembly factor BamE, partial [Caballeronia sp.]